MEKTVARRAVLQTSTPQRGQRVKLLHPPALQGMLCTVRRVSPLGALTVEVVQGAGAYRAGDRLCVAQYEVEPLEEQAHGKA